MEKRENKKKRFSEKMHIAATSTGNSIVKSSADQRRAASKMALMTKNDRVRKVENERENQVLLNKMLSIMNVSTILRSNLFIY